MSVKDRQFRWGDDVQKMHRLIVDSWKRIGPRSAYHIGDLYWRLFYPQLGTEPVRDIALWERAGELLGFAWFEPPDHGDMLARPDADRLKLETRMLDWLEERARTSDVGESLSIPAFEPDPERTSLLERSGYRRGTPRDYHNWQSLASPTPEPVLPAGYTVRNTAGEEEIEKRAEAHRLAWATWGRSTLTTSVYRSLMGSPGYRQDLDLVVVSPDGQFVACCNCWLDEQNRVGEFEPVGCHPDYRRKGLAKAMIFEGLRRLRAWGAEAAIVYSGSINAPAMKLYESAGFQVASTGSDHMKDLR